MRDQYRFHGILLPGIVPKDLYKKALLARFHNNDILQGSYPKSGMFSKYISSYALACKEEKAVLFSIVYY